MSKQNSVKNALRSFLETYSDSLTNGIEHQGVRRKIREINLSSLTPSRQTYSITVRINSVSYQQVPSANIRDSVVVVYDVELHIVDYALPQKDDEAVFERVHSDFDLLVDRIMELFRSVHSIVDGDNKFTVGKEFRLSNRTNWYDTGKEVFPSLYSVLSLKLTDYCN